jgi:hypothetical protein
LAAFGLLYRRFSIGGRAESRSSSQVSHAHAWDLVGETTFSVLHRFEIRSGVKDENDTEAKAASHFVCRRTP